MIWSLVEAICRALPPDERQAVLGDLTERGETGLSAVADVAGLVARRQLSLWKSWRPWVASLGLLPVLLMFCNVAWSIVWVLERYPWRNRPQSHQQIVLMLCSATLLAALCSWTVGFVMASLARRATVSAAALLTLRVLWGVCHPQTATAPLDMVCTGLCQLLLCLAPFAHGLHAGASCGHLSPRRSFLLAAAALLPLVALLPSQWPSAKDLLIFAFFSWPILYLLATARWREPEAGRPIPSAN